jgi:hypothetical protein
MKKIFLSSLIASGLLVSSFAFADSANVSVSPATGNQVAGSSVSATVSVNPSGNKVCVVSGTVSFTNLSCTSIAVTSGLVAQTAPTCASPNFTLGIPKCTTALQNLFSITTTGGAVGSASITLSGVKVIGAGTDVASTSQSASYTVTTGTVQQKAVTTGTSTIAPTQQKITKTTTATTEQQTPPETQTASIPASAGAASVSTSFANVIGSPAVVGIIALLIGILGGIWYADNRKHKIT